MGTTRAPLDPIYHTHSNFDSYHWMSKFADPGFVMHKAIGQFLTLMLYQLVNEEVVPLEPANYGVEMRAWLEDLKDVIAHANVTSTIDLGELEMAVTRFVESAQQFNAARDMAVTSNSSLPIKELNHKARDCGRGFVSQSGLSGREFYRHLVFAPGVDTGYAPVTYPGVTEAVAAGNLTLARDFVGKTAKAILAAAQILRP